MLVWLIIIIFMYSNFLNRETMNTELAQKRMLELASNTGKAEAMLSILMIDINHESTIDSELREKYRQSINKIKMYVSENFDIANEVVGGLKLKIDIDEVLKR